MTPKPYIIERLKLIDDEPSSYLVGQLTSPIEYPLKQSWASI